MVAEQPGAALQLLQSPPAPLHLSRKQRRRKGESSFRLSLSTSCSFGELRCRATCQGRRALDRLASGSRKVLGNANASAMAAAKARLITPSSRQRWPRLPGLPAAAGQPAAGSSFDGSSSMATLNGVGSLPSSAVRSLCLGINFSSPRQNNGFTTPSPPSSFLPSHETVFRRGRSAQAGTAGHIPLVHPKKMLMRRWQTGHFYSRYTYTGLG